MEPQTIYYYLLKDGTRSPVFDSEHMANTWRYFQQGRGVTLGELSLSSCQMPGVPSGFKVEFWTPSVEYST